MGYSIRLVDNWGKESGLDSNFGFMAKVQQESPAWNELMTKNKIQSNDGDHIALWKVEKKIDELLADAKKTKDKEVSDYLIDIVRLTQKNITEDGVQGHLALAFY